MQDSKIDTGHWLLSENLDYNPDAYGFVYLITNQLDGRKYIGSKQLIKKITRKPKKRSYKTSKRKQK